MRIFIVFVFALAQNFLYADVSSRKANSYEEIQALYAQQNNIPDQSLLVFDIDDTLLTMTQHLGGIGWWDWQNDLLINNINSDKRVAKNFPELVKIQYLLFNLIKMKPTDAYVLPFLNETIEEGRTIMGLTARGSEVASVTQSQFNTNGFKDKNEKPMFKQKGLTLKNGKTSSAGDFACPNLARNILYYQGIAFVEGQDKGQALLCMLKKANKTYSSILFVDDSKQNIDAVERVFKDKKEWQVTTVLYTHEHQKNIEFLADPLLQDKVFTQWSIIKQALFQTIEQQYLL